MCGGVCGCVCGGCGCVGVCGGGGVCGVCGCGGGMYVSFSEIACVG